MPRLAQDGGDVFPRQRAFRRDGPAEHWYVCQQKGGMTLRQWYAGQALMGILARPCDHKRTAEQRAAEARQHADAMIEARI